ncbi:MAG: hypothetical protein WDN04_22415 [Rhodospirillales bacterium]
MAFFLACLFVSLPTLADVKIATWNLNWFTLRPPHDAELPADVHPRTAADIAALHRYADMLAADVVAFEEVDGPQAAANCSIPRATVSLRSTRMSCSRSASPCATRSRCGRTMIWRRWM